MGSGQRGKCVPDTYQRVVLKSIWARRELYPRDVRTCCAQWYEGYDEDLFEGTSKVTHAPPGYCGYISKKKPNASEATRGSRHDMFAVDEYRFNTTGYTGNRRANFIRERLKP